MGVDAPCELGHHEGREFGLEPPGKFLADAAVAAPRPVFQSGAGVTLVGVRGMEIEHQACLFTSRPLEVALERPVAASAYVGVVGIEHAVLAEVGVLLDGIVGETVTCRDLHVELRLDEHVG